ncbi:hypothetical protein AGLY_011648 [Aphis glycines]|uniref:Uncharacterized protein n=1 Tax=Aphis glycines TaxID=307491 RepID=A0A6G0TAZ0_APHGL|nr:hypothetical protein AGLY_011648 [Aphis glycines]
MFLLVTPLEMIFFFNSIKRLIRLPVGITIAPANANFLPIPEEAPVINTTFDFKGKTCVLGLVGELNLNCLMFLEFYGTLYCLKLDTLNWQKLNMIRHLFFSPSTHFLNNYYLLQMNLINKFFLRTHLNFVPAPQYQPELVQSVGYVFVYNTPCITNKVKSAEFQLGINLLPLMFPHLNIDAGNPFLITFKINCSASHLMQFTVCYKLKTIFSKGLNSAESLIKQNINFCKINAPTNPVAPVRSTLPLFSTKIPFDLSKVIFGKTDLSNLPEASTTGNLYFISIFVLMMMPITLLHLLIQHNLLNTCQCLLLRWIRHTQNLLQYHNVHKSLNFRPILNNPNLQFCIIDHQILLALYWVF